MPMEPSLISEVEDDAFDLLVMVERAGEDNVISLAEYRAIRERLVRLHKRARQCHKAQRKAISVLRRGVVVTQVYREFGPDEEPLDAA